MRKFVMLAVALIALSARAEQKNVQLLTNMSDLQLQRTMNMIRASLGVHCDFCHVVDDKVGWQFEKDDKKEKRTGREMIAMVLKLNKEQFGGKTEVSCWTCHRGSTHPNSLVTLPQAAPPFPTPKPKPADLPALSEIVKIYAGQLGNVKRLQKPRLLKGTREGFDGKLVPIEIEESGGRVHITSVTPAGKVEQVITEKGGWSRDAQGSIHEFDASALENFREIAASLEPTLPADIPPDARVTGRETIENHVTTVVAYRTSKSTSVRLYFSDSWILVRRVVLKETPIGVIPQQTDFDQWRDHGDLRFPYLIKTSLVDPWVGSTRHYNEVLLDAKIDESVFAKPK